MKNPMIMMLAALFLIFGAFSCGGDDDYSKGEPCDCIPSEEYKGASLTACEFDNHRCYYEYQNVAIAFGEVFTEMCFWTIDCDKQARCSWNEIADCEIPE